VQPTDYSSFDEPARSGRSRPVDLDAVVRQLVKDLRPTSRHSVAVRLAAGLAGGAVISVLSVGLLLGYRPDMAVAMRTSMFWVKLAYALALGLLSLGVAECLTRPGVQAAGRARWLLLPFGLVALVAFVQLASAPAGLRRAMVMGGSAVQCPWWIVAFSAPPLVGLVGAARSLAPTCLRLAGASIGLAAGGFGAAAYALHCQESAGPFLAIWYSLGIGLAAVAGALLGPRALRW
jgi:hypothetical protein